jgi:hypothetical protein
MRIHLYVLLYVISLTFAVILFTGKQKHLCGMVWTYNVFPFKGSW